MAFDSSVQKPEAPSASYGFRSAAIDPQSVIRFVGKFGIRVRTAPQLPSRNFEAHAAAYPTITNSGRTLVVDKAAMLNPQSAAWEIAHFFAHMVQWSDAQKLTRPGRTRVEARTVFRFAEVSIRRYLPAELRMAVRYEVEAHLLTAEILAAVFPQADSGMLRAFALEKAKSDLAVLTGQPARLVRRLVDEALAEPGSCFLMLPSPAAFKLPKTPRAIPYLRLDERRSASRRPAPIV